MLTCCKCNEILLKDDSLKCCRCAKEAHYFCVGQNQRNFVNMNKDKYKCLECKTVNASPPLASGGIFNSTFKLDQGNANSMVAGVSDPKDDMKCYIDNKFQNLESKINDLVQELKNEYSQRFEALERMIKEKDEKIITLENKLDDLENRNRKMNIEIRNVPETKGENVKAIVERIGQVIGMENIREDDVQVAHRVYSKKAGGDRPIVAMLSSRLMKDKWIDQYKRYKANNNFQPLLAADIQNGFKKTPVYIFEHITAARKMVLTETRNFAKQVGIKYVWVRDAVILTRQTEKAKVYRVTNAIELQEMKKVFSSRTGNGGGR
ncbi:hypothetical protein M8J77_011963 [Diaphorina citri]|nr:hypothetical protein M8J77_011963 [Diaphorina citri]